MKLSDYFPQADIVKEGYFETLGYVDSGIKMTMAYCDNIRYLEEANANENISCIITTNDIHVHVAPNKGVLISTKPRSTF